MEEYPPTTNTLDSLEPQKLTQGDHTQQNIFSTSQPHALAFSHPMHSHPNHPHITHYALPQSNHAYPPHPYLHNHSATIHAYPQFLSRSCAPNFFTQEFHAQPIGRVVQNDSFTLPLPLETKENQFTNFTTQSNEKQYFQDDIDIFGSDKDELPYVCYFEGCVKAFRNKGDLIKHIRSHTGERPHKCKYPGCPAAFTTTSHLRRHERAIHQKISSFKCHFAFCGKVFPHKSSLDYHLMCHTKETPYSCPRCDYSARSSSNLRKHIKSQHGDLYVTPKPRGRSVQAMPNQMIPSHLDEDSKCETSINSMVKDFPSEKHKEPKSKKKRYKKEPENLRVENDTDNLVSEGQLYPNSIDQDLYSYERPWYGDALPNDETDSTLNCSCIHPRSNPQMAYSNQNISFAQNVQYDYPIVESDIMHSGEDKHDTLNTSLPGTEENHALCSHLRCTVTSGPAFFQQNREPDYSYITNRVTPHSLNCIHPVRIRHVNKSQKHGFFSSPHNLTGANSPDEMSYSQSFEHSTH